MNRREAIKAAGAGALAAAAGLIGCTTMPVLSPDAVPVPDPEPTEPAVLVFTYRITDWRTGELFEHGSIAYFDLREHLNLAHDRVDYWQSKGKAAAASVNLIKKEES